MCILNQAMRDDFISSLSSTPKYSFARSIPSKSISDYSDVLLACENVYNSGIIFPQGGPLAKRNGTPHIHRILSDLANKLYKYFADPTNASISQSSFDKFHDSLCIKFLHDLNIERRSVGLMEIYYGTAQKMVNMVFKHLACYSDSPKYAEWFRHCHMALDGFTYYPTNLNYKLSYYRDVICNPARRKSLTAWSKLNKEEGEEDKKGYLEIISDIRSYIPNRAEAKTYNDYLEIGHSIGLFANIPPLELEDDYVLTPFEAEFFIWKICAEGRSLTPATITRLIASF